MSTATAARSTHETSRKQVLIGHLQRLHKLTVLHPTASGTQTLECGEMKLRINPWEWSALIQGFKDGASGRNWTQLLAEAVALQTKCFEDLEAQRAAASNDNPALTPEVPEVPPLAIDLAIGEALLNDLYEAMDGLRKAGGNDKAEALAQFTNRLRVTLDTVRDAAGPDVAASANELADRYPRENGPLLSVPAPRTAATSTTTPPQSRSRWSRMTEKSRDRVRLAAIGIAVGMIVGGTLFVLPILNRPELRQMSSTDFSSYPEVETVLSRAPNLYLRLSPARWETLDETGRRRLIENVTKQAEAAGFSGAHFNTSDGKSVARWLKRSGTQLF